MRKICVITGSRAEYGLLYWLIKELNMSKSLQLQLIVTGSHLRSEYGNTYLQIQDEFNIDKKIDILNFSNDALGVCKSMAEAMAQISKALNDLKPDIVVVLGDRYEIFCAACAALVLGIPIAHIHGGELSAGAIDEAFRHSITKMSHIHFTANKEYAKRVAQLGEDPKFIFNVGGMGIENIKRLKLLNKSKFQSSINFKLNKKNILVTYHPVTTQKDNQNEFKEILKALNELKDTNIIFTKANSDAGGIAINKMIDEYVKTNSNSIAFASLGSLRYLSALKHVDIILGNSSSGLLEAPSMGVATINIGSRQDGRLKALSVIDVKPIKSQILKAIKLAYTPKFQKIVQKKQNPYGNAKPSKAIIKILKNINLKGITIKRFKDIV